MKTISSSAKAPQANTCTTISLQQLVSRLTTSLLPLSVQRCNLVINDIPRGLQVTGDENMMAFVLWNMIHSAVTSTRSECIRIESIISGEEIVIRLKGVGAYYYHTISGRYREVQYMASMMGGTISLSGDKQNGSQVSFSFAHNSAAA